VPTAEEMGWRIRPAPVKAGGSIGLPNRHLPHRQRRRQQASFSDLGFRLQVFDRSSEFC
jgi:hypothetical protein